MANGRVTIHLDEDLAAPYRLRAESQDRSLSAEVRQALRRDLEREHERDDEQPRAAA